MKKLKQLFVYILTICLLANCFIFNTYANNTAAGQEMRNNIIKLAGIANLDNLDSYITRGEFAKMIVMSSKYKDSATSVSGTAVYNDVPKDYEYAPYIKLATQNGYMVGYLGGLFKPYELVSYKDMTRSCLALLDYTNDDFTGNQVEGRIALFKSLELDKNIFKTTNEFVTKTDCINAIYNTLKEKPKNGSSIYGTLFKVSLDSTTKEIDPTGLVKTSMKGPFIATRKKPLASYIPFHLDEGNYFINGSPATYRNIADEISNTGFVVLYYNEPTKTCYAYRRGASKDSTVVVCKGFVTNIYYNASDNLTPNSAEIDHARYEFGNAEVKFAFSFAGTVKVGDQVIIIYQSNSDESSTYDGSISAVFLYENK